MCGFNCRSGSQTAVSDEGAKTSCLIVPCNASHADHGIRRETDSRVIVVDGRSRKRYDATGCKELALVDLTGKC